MGAADARARQRRVHRGGSNQSRWGRPWASVGIGSLPGNQSRSAGTRLAKALTNRRRDWRDHRTVRLGSYRPSSTLITGRNEELRPLGTILGAPACRAKSCCSAWPVVAAAADKLTPGGQMPTEKRARNFCGRPNGVPVARLLRPTIGDAERRLSWHAHIKAEGSANGSQVVD